VVGAEEHRNMRVAKLAQITGDDIDLGAPAVVERGSGGEELLPLVVSQVALNAVVEGDGLVVGRADLVPGEGDDGAVAILAFDFFNHGRTGEH